MSNNKTPDITRRKFLGGAGAAAVGTAALVTSGTSDAASSKKTNPVNDAPDDAPKEPF